MEDRAKLREEVRHAGLVFPILASARVLVRNNGGGGTTQSGSPEAVAAEHAVSAVIVEASEQILEPGKAASNPSMYFVNELLKSLDIRAPDRTLVAPVNAVKHSPHG